MVTSGIGIILSIDNESGLDKSIYAPLYKIFVKNYITTYSYLDLKVIK